MQADPPYTVNVDPQFAQELAAQGASLLVLDLPPGTLLGINHYTFATGPKFKGVKMLPPGAHFITYRAVSAESGASPVTGFFLHLQPRQVVVRRWNPATETLMCLEEEEAGRYTAGVKRYDFDAGMAPYNLPAHAAWSHISDRITPELVHRLSPASGDMSIIAEASELELVEPRTQAERQLMNHLTEGRARQQQRQQQQQQEQQQEQRQGPTPQAANLPDQGQSHVAQQPAAAAALQPVDEEMQGPGEPMAATNTRPDDEGMHVEDSPAQTQAPAKQPAPSTLGRCSYTHLPRMVKHAGATPAELTALNMDKSRLLQQVLAQQYGGQMDMLLGELQFAFIAFVYGQTLGGYAQWKALLLLLLGCETAALHTSTSHYVTLLHVLRHQLEVSMGPAPGAMPAEGAAAPFGVSIVEELLPDSFLRHMLGSFFSMLQENDREVTPELAGAAAELKQLLRLRLGWEYDMQLLGGHLPEGSDDEEGPVVVEDPDDLVRL